jgi:hypothetical protein
LIASGRARYGCGDGGLDSRVWPHDCRQGRTYLLDIVSAQVDGVGRKCGGRGGEGGGSGVVNECG